MTRPSDTSCHEHYHLFDTPLGDFGIAWGDNGMTRLKLPGANRQATEARLREIAPGADAADPPEEIRRVITLLRQYLDGRRVDFSAVTIDLGNATPFHKKVYEAARAVGWGQTVSYADLARSAGSPRAARSVGQALGRNPAAVVIPCHRILASGNAVGGFTAYGGTFTKERLLALEGVHLNRGLDDGPAPAAKGRRIVRA